MLKNNLSFLWLIICFAASCVLVPQLYAEKPTINVTVNPTSKEQPAKTATPESSEAQKGMASGAPAIFIEQTQFDAGDVWEGDVISHSFIVKNIGKGELLISNVKPG